MSVRVPDFLPEDSFHTMLMVTHLPASFLSLNYALKCIIRSVAGRDKADSCPLQWYDKDTKMAATGERDDVRCNAGSTTMICDKGTVTTMCPIPVNFLWKVISHIMVPIVAYICGEPRCAGSAERRVPGQGHHLASAPV
jgi:hypothetical protein